MIYCSLRFHKSKPKWRKHCTGSFPLPPTQPSKPPAFKNNYMLRCKLLEVNFIVSSVPLPDRRACSSFVENKLYDILCSICILCSSTQVLYTWSWFGNGRKRRIGNQWRFCLYFFSFSTSLLQLLFLFCVFNDH